MRSRANCVNLARRGQVSVSYSLKRQPYRGLQVTTQAIGLWCLAILILCVPACAKTGSTIYTPERIANARRNIERCDWAKKIKDAAVAAADHYAAQSDDWLWNLPTPQSIPRGIHVNRQMGCPKCGHAIDKFGNYPWSIDVLANPWKITCPSCGEVFPTNDFGKFYESGKDSNGVFVYEKADRSLLFNTEHPDPNDPLHTYGVDDSMGWRDAKGDVYRFIGYYGHYGVWSTVQRIVSNCRDAYLFTGDPKYARKAGLLLYRIAEFYPDMDFGFWAQKGFENSDGGSGLGKVYGRIWESALMDSFMTSYDGIYPALDDPQLLAELSDRTGRTVTAADLRAFIERNIIRQVHDGILARKIEGNEGMYQNTMATAAIVLDEPGTSEQWLDWIFADGDVRHGVPTGGNMLGIFSQRVDDDGMGDEASPSYNAIWRSLFRSISDLLALCPRYTKHQFAANPKYRKMFEAPVRLTCAGRFSPHIGDTSCTGNPGLASISANDLAYAFRAFGDPKYAQMAYMLNGNKADGLRLDIFDPEPEAISKEIEAAVEKYGPYQLKTDNMPSYGCAILQSGSASDARALSLYYGRNTGHGHRDTLNIELFALGLDMMPDLGYPEYAFSDCRSRSEWTSNTISHNTVVVDRKPQENNRVGVARFVVEGKGVSAAEVYAGKPYPQTSLYQRTVAMVDVSEKDFYVVDVFRVKGGKHHMYSLHGPEGEIETEGLKLVDQPKGTLAGEDVEPYADLKASGDYGANASGYQYLYDVRRDSHPGAQPSITYKVVDTWHVLKEPKEVRLRVTLVNPLGEVILAHGDPPRNKPGNPRNLWYILSPHSAGESTFVSVIEPYSGSRLISSIERKDDGDTVILTVTTASGRVDTIISALDPIKTTVSGLEFAGRFGVVSEQNGKTEARVVVP
jgi:hypothetical protein